MPQQGPPLFSSSFLLVQRVSFHHGCHCISQCDLCILQVASVISVFFKSAVWSLYSSSHQCDLCMLWVTSVISKWFESPVWSLNVSSHQHDLCMLWLFESLVCMLWVAIVVSVYLHSPVFLFQLWILQWPVPPLSADSQNPHEMYVPSSHGHCVRPLSRGDWCLQWHTLHRGHAGEGQCSSSLHCGSGDLDTWTFEKNANWTGFVCKMCEFSG